MPSTYAASSPNDAKFEMMMNTMERFMDSLTLDNKPLNRDHIEPQIRNPNFKRPNPPPIPQNRQRDMSNPRNPDDQQVQPHFLENYVVDEEDPDPIEYQIQHFHDLNSEIYLTEEEHNMFAQEDDNNDSEEELEE